MLTQKDRERLIGVGFIELEVEAFHNAVDPAGIPQPLVDLDSPTWQNAMASRKAWVMDKVDRGWSPEKITQSLVNFYALRTDRNPFDFLKAEYKPKNKLQDFKAAREARGRITSVKDTRRYPFRPTYQG